MRKLAAFAFLISIIFILASVPVLAEPGQLCRLDKECSYNYRITELDESVNNERCKRVHDDPEVEAGTYFGRCAFNEPCEGDTTCKSGACTSLGFCLDADVYECSTDAHCNNPSDSRFANYAGNVGLFVCAKTDYLDGGGRCVHSGDCRNDHDCNNQYIVTTAGHEKYYFTMKPTPPPDKMCLNAELCIDYTTDFSTFAYSFICNKDCKCEENTQVEKHYCTPNFVFVDDPGCSVDDDCDKDDVCFANMCVESPLVACEKYDNTFCGQDKMCRGEYDTFNQDEQSCTNDFGCYKDEICIDHRCIKTADPDKCKWDPVNLKGKVIQEKMDEDFGELAGIVQDEETKKQLKENWYLETLPPMKFRKTQEELDKNLGEVFLDEWFWEKMEGIATKTHPLDPRFWWQHLRALLDHGLTGSDADFVKDKGYGRCGDSMLWLQQKLEKELGLPPAEATMSITGESWKIFTHTSVVMRPEGMSNDDWGKIVIKLSTKSTEKKGLSKKDLEDIKDLMVLDPYKKKVITVGEFVKGWRIIRIS